MTEKDLRNIIKKNMEEDERGKAVTQDRGREKKEREKDKDRRREWPRKTDEEEKEKVTNTGEWEEL